MTIPIPIIISSTKEQYMNEYMNEYMMEKDRIRDKEIKIAKQRKQNARIAGATLQMIIDKICDLPNGLYAFGKMFIDGFDQDSCKNKKIK